MSTHLFLSTAAAEVDHDAYSSIARLLDVLLDAVAYWRSDGRCLYVNPAYAKSLNRDRAQLIGRHLLEMHGEAHFASLKPLLDSVLAGKQASGEIRLARSAQRDTWWQIDLYPDFDPSGQVVGYFSFGREVNSARALALEAENRQDAIRRLIESINLPMACWDRDARMVFCNSPYEAWASRSQGELLGSTLSELFGATAWTKAKAGFAKAFNGESTVYERQVVTPEGGLRWHRVHVFPGARDELPIQTVFTIAFDIDDDIRLRQQLAANEARIRRIVEAIDLPIVRLDQARKITYCNDAYAHFVGKSVETVLGSSADELFGTQQLADRSESFSRAFAGESIAYNELIPMPQGERWARIRLVGDRDATGAVRAIYAIGYDIDHEVRERKKSELARRHLERITENLPFPLAYLSVDGRYEFANRALFKRNGLSNEQVIGRHVRDVRGEEIWGSIEGAFSSALAGEASEIEAEIVSADGTARWARTTFAPDRDSEGEVVGVYASSFDVDEIKRAHLELGELHGELSAHFDRSPVAVVKYDALGNVVQWSKRAEQMLGVPASEVLGKRFNLQRVCPQDRDAVKAVIRQVLSGTAETVINTHRYLHVDGSFRWIEWYNSVLKNPQGGIASVLSLGVDITARIDAEQRLKRFGDGIPNPVTYLGLDSRYQYMNSAFAEWTGITPAQMIGKTPVEARGEYLGGLFQGLITRALGGEDVRVERLASLRNGEERWIRTHFSPDRDESGRIIGCYNVSFDIHDAKLTEQQLQHLADHDSLTGALTRNAFFRELECRLTSPEEQSVSLLFVDLDGFKAINDRFGHAEGDELLRSVAQKLIAMLGSTDCLGRLGGDEFVVLTQIGSQQVAQALGERIIELVSSARVGSDESPAQFSASVGIATRWLPDSDVSSDGLVRAADKAMYEAKRSGGGQVRFA